MKRVIELSVYLPDRLGESEAVLAELRALCERYLPGRHRISVVDPSLDSMRRRFVTTPFVTTDFGAKGKNTFNLDHLETPQLIAALQAEAANASGTPRISDL